MIPIASLWLPILLSAVGVFVASSIIHMALGYHNKDHDKMPDEADVLASMRGAGVQGGFVLFPPCGKPQGSGFTRDAGEVH